MINGLKVVALIPARMRSSRLPNKPLREIEGIPMIIHVLKRTEMCKELDEVYIATEDEIIKEAVEKYGGKVIMTRDDHPTGTDRMAEAVEKIDADLIVNVQGDEPLVLPEHISEGIKAVATNSDINISCLAVETNQLNNKEEVKLVINEKSEIMYFSRNDLPSTLRVNHDRVLKQYCIYTFRKPFLSEYASWEQTPLEKIEFVELLRVLEKGHKIKGVKIDNATIQSVDTELDLERVRELMKIDKLKDKYLT
tara:strand:- start:5267 stop:6022 length:756 start_codon:yes stop_codon:yes gene_type:complete